MYRKSACFNYQDILDVGFDGVISAGSFIQIDGKYIYENFLDSKRLQQAIVLSFLMRR